MSSPDSTYARGSFRASLLRALDRRHGFMDQNRTEAFRVFSGAADGVDGVFVDIFGEGAVLIVYEDKPPRWFDAKLEAATALEVLKPLGVRGVYLKPFAKDRSRLGGELPASATEATPAAGESLPESIL